MAENENNLDKEDIVIPEIVPTPQQQQPKAAKNPRGAMIASIVCGSLAIVFAILSIIVIMPFIRLFVSVENEAALFLGIVMFFLYMVTFGLVSWVPALALSIASLCCSVKCWSAQSKGMKAVGIIFFITSLLVILICVAVLILFLIPGSVGWLA